MTCVDWTKLLRPASFRGARFYVQGDQAKYGRRLVVHEFPNRDRPFVEDMGEKAIHYSIDAYVAGDASLAQKSALIAACRQRGPGSLSLPTDGGASVRCITCERAFELDRLGYIGFKLEFVEAGVGLSGFPVGLLEALAGTAAVAAIGGIVSAFMRTFSTVAGEAWVVAEAVSAVGGVVSALDAARQRLPMIDDVARADAYQALVAIQRDADTITRGGADVVPVRPLAFAEAIEAPTGAIVTRVSEALTMLREITVSEEAAAEALWPLVDYGLPDPAPASTGSAETMIATNTAAINAAVRRLVIGEVAVAVAFADFGDRTAAVRWRSRIAEVFAREIGTAPPELRPLLADVRGKAVDAISRKLADLQPVVTIADADPAPSIVWAYRLYGDAAQAADLVARNRVRRPSVMPGTFTARAAPRNRALTPAEARAGLS